MLVRLLNDVIRIQKLLRLLVFLSIIVVIRKLFFGSAQ